MASKKRNIKSKPNKIGDFIITPSEERKKKIDGIINERKNKIEDFLKDTI